MAQRETSLSAVKWAYVRVGDPDTHFPISDASAYSVGDEARILVGIQSVDPAIRRNRILRVGITVQALTTYHTNYPRVSVLNGDFDANTVTYNTSPKWDGSGFNLYAAAGAYGEWLDYTRSEAVDTTPTSSILSAMQRIIQNKGYAIGGTSGVQAKTKTTTGSAVMVSLSYDPDVILTSRPYPTKYPQGTVDPRIEQVFEWEPRKAQSGFYCADESFRQVSATFYWKLDTDDAWTEIQIEGETGRATIPANTLPTAATVSWYIEATDEDGTTASSPVYSFSTPTNQIYIAESPTGAEVDIRNQLVFRWRLLGGLGDYDQESATLYWRESEDDAWSSITTGSEKIITVPALTFPTYSTISWYIEATDTGGHTAESSVSQFSTATVKITPVAYPNGENISTRVPHTFSWRYYNQKYTDYSQQSAVFYWQRVPAESWNEIPISGNVKTISIPANTFPTGAKVRWYVLGTDVGGTSTITPQLTFETVTTKITPQNCPTSGYWDPRLAITFSWYYSSVLGEYTQQSAVLYWRESGEEVWNEIPVSGDIQTITVPENTFPVASEIEWYLAGTDTGGTTSTTEQYIFSTTASTAYAICVSPVGQVEDGTKPITLRWIVRNDDGSLPLRTVVEWKYDTESQLEWKTILDTVDTGTELTVPGGTFHAGAVEWRVSAYNRDLIQGPTNAASFVCLMAPDAPAGLSATPVPRTTIRWQASGQEAYEIVIDGETVAKEYGPGVYSYQKNEPLEDGEHVIAVRVQGLYGFWSNWSETTILVRNDAADTLTLSGVFVVDAQLVWSVNTEDLSATMNVYRDGIWIAAVGNSLTFTDRLALGEHSYYVELWKSDGNYVRSNTVTGTMATPETVIALMAGGEWMRINLRESFDRRGSFSWQKEFATRNVLGSPYPIIEVGTHIDLTGSFSCTFPDTAAARAFEALYGEHVIIKTPGGDMLNGVLLNVAKQPYKFYTSYSFSLQQASLEDFVAYET